MSKRRLVVLFDGTWYKPESNTNVERLRRLIAPRDEAGVEQLVEYIPGVGVAPGLVHLLGGAFGYGLSGNVKDGYRWLCERWRHGDEIWLFGFSRGAYAARSLAGLIRKCGLLRCDGAIADGAVTRAYAFYRDAATRPGDGDAATWRAARSLETDIHFIGVWDTVGALGIPGIAAWFPFARARYQFHDADISHIVKHAYQALALDEHRIDFAPTKWVRNPARLGPGESPTAKKPGQIEVEQRWFVGAHADVGGGYDHDGAGRAPDPLPDLPLAWLQRKAMAAGLACNKPFSPAPDAAAGVPRDAYAEFMFGIYRRFKPPFVRVIGNGINETVDESVWRHSRLASDYRSPTLARALRDDVIAAPPGVA
ncbi:DUF2235 domain-containing protein [Rhodanobacter geophilus]|uniref:DUF2235 domain-containing protein n=1 Tax=Rhodanobacter geophilus TaxID=3162488 RepID=A0ABV3QP91_9GAMM